MGKARKQEAAAVAKPADPNPNRDRRIEWMPLGQLQTAKRNPKAHSSEIGTSVGRFGYVEPIVLDERTSRIVAGHGRREALLEMRKQGQAPPSGVKAEGDEWLVPVLRGWASRSDAEAEAYLVASNRLTEKGGWDDQGLAELMKDLQAAGEGSLEGIGFNEKEIAKLINDAARDALPDDERMDATMDPPKNPYVKVGELWALGDHRLLCGNAEDPANWKRLLAGDEQPKLLHTDPPYGVSYDASWRARAGLGFNNAKHRTGLVSNDGNADWREVYRLSGCDIAYIWHASAFASVVEAGLVDAGFEVRQQIIWVKRLPAVGRSHYHWRHEPCWYAVKKGATATWVGDRKQTTVWEMASPIHVFNLSSDDRTPHPTQKPIHMFEIPLLNHTTEGELMVDPFAGSGSAIVACERLHRRCRAMDVDPAYAQIAIERWQTLFNKKAELLEGVPQ